MLSIRFWVGIVINVIITMILIVLIKKMSTKYNIPFLSALSNEV